MPPVHVVFLVYPVGTVTSSLAGRLADRYSRRAVGPVGCAVFAAGLALTIPESLPLVVLGLTVMTGGFFAVHGVASGWVPARAFAGQVAPGPAAALYLFAYYLGSSVFGSVSGQAWTAGGWPAVLALTLGLVVAVAVLSAVLHLTPSLDPHRR